MDSKLIIHYIKNIILLCMKIIKSLDWQELAPTIFISDASMVVDSL